MAEAGLQAPTFIGATGGIGDDLFTGINGSFYSSKNINIRDNAQGISLAKALVKESSTTVVGKINEIIKISTGYHIAVGASAGIYVRSGTTWTKKTTTITGDILSVCEFHGYVYLATAAKLHRIALANVPTRASEVVDWNALESASYHPLMVSMGDMYIGNGGKLDKVNILDTYEVLITLDSAATIKELNDLGGSIRAVAIPAIGNSVVYLWDGTDNPPDQSIPLMGYDIYQSIIFNGYNYLTSQDGLGILDGYKVFPIKEISGFNNNINSITVHKKKLYIGGTGGVYVFGQKNKNYPEVLNFELSTSNGVATDIIGAVYSDGTDLFVAWSNLAGSTFGIDKLSTSTYYTTGELVTRGYYGKSLGQIKEGVNILTGFKPMITGQTITLSYSLDGGSYTTILAMTSASVLKAAFTEDMFISGSFQYIQFKILLEGPGTSTPEFYTILMTFNNNLNR